MFLMVSMPGARPVTILVLDTIVAIVVLLEDHVPFVPVVETVVVPPLLHISVRVALTIPAFGAAVIVTVLVVVAFEQPPVPLTVYVIVAVPAVTGVTEPVNESIVAIDVLLVVQTPPLEVEENVVVPFEQIV